MRKSVVFAAAAALASAGVARANFHISAVIQNLADGNERTEIFALNNGVDGTGTKAIASDITIADLSGPNLVIGFVNNAPTAHADVMGVFAPDPYNSDRSFVNLLGDPSGGTSGIDNDPTAYSVVSTVPANTHANFTHGVTQFEVVGVNLFGGVDATSAANGGKGALIAVAVAPIGDQINFQGSIGGDSGDPQPFSWPSIPEPASLSMLGVGALGLLVRRRR